MEVTDQGWSFVVVVKLAWLMSPVSKSAKETTGIYFTVYVLLLPVQLTVALVHDGTTEVISGVTAGGVYVTSKSSKYHESSSL